MKLPPTLTICLYYFSLLPTLLCNPFQRRDDHSLATELERRPPGACPFDNIPASRLPTGAIRIETDIDHFGIQLLGIYYPPHYLCANGKDRYHDPLVHIEDNAFDLLHPLREEVYDMDDYDGHIGFFFGKAEEVGHAFWVYVVGEFDGKTGVSKQLRFPPEEEKLQETM